MQMAKTSSALARMAAARLPYVSVLTDPTTGGVSASLAMLGDVNIGEPKALIGFTGARIIQQTVRETLPEGFQRAEFLLDHGALDMIVDRRDMRDRIAGLLTMFMHKPAVPAELSRMAGPRERSPRFRRLADWLAWQETLHPNAIDLGLDRLQRTLDRLGWRRPACPVITVAGTNGKGSCVALTARILARGRLSRRHVHFAASAALQRAHRRRRRRSFRCSADGGVRAHRRGSRRRHADVLRVQRRGSLARVRRRAARCRRARSRLGRTARCSQRRRRRRRAWSRRSISIIANGSAATAKPSGARRRGSFAPAARRSSARATCRHRSASTPGRSAPICCSSAATSTGSRAGERWSWRGRDRRAARPAARRRCTARSSTTTRPPCSLRWKRWSRGCLCLDRQSSAACRR